MLIPTFVACNKTPEDTPETSGDESSFEFKISASDLSKYKIICAEKANNRVINCALAIRDAIKQLTGITLECTDDFVKAESAFTVGQYEILVGDTNRSTEHISSKLSSLEYSVAVEDEKIYIVGSSDSMLEYGISKFISMHIGEEGIVINKKKEINKVSMADFDDKLMPVLSFDFNEFKDGNTSATNADMSARLVNYDIEGGYKGNAVRFHGTPTKYGGAVLPNGAVYNAVSDTTAYTVSMWIMPYQSYHGSTLYRLLTLFGKGNNEMLIVEYSSPLIKVTAAKPDGSGKVECSFPYALETAIPAFDAVNTNDGVWQLVTITVDYATGKIDFYINGQTVATNDKIGSNLVCDGITGKSTTTYGDCIGGNTKGNSRSFNGVIDCFNVYNTALSPSAVEVLYRSFGSSETPSVTEDQAILDGIVEKLGSGLAVLGNSANTVYRGRVVKADGTDYSVVNPIISGKIHLSENLAERFAKDQNKKITINAVTVDGRKYYPATELCSNFGLQYIDFTAKNGMFVILASDSTMTDKDTQAIERLSTYCTVKNYEPKIPVEQTRTVIATSDTAAGDYTYSPSIVRCSNTLYASRDISCDRTEVFASEDNGKTWEYRGQIKNLWWATIFAHKDELYLIGRYDTLGFGTGGDHYIGVTKSTDGGRTWTAITAEQGGVSYNGYAVHCGPTPVIVANGKIYRVFESTKGEKRVFIAMCDVDADLLNPENWSFSNHYSNNSFPNEGNAVVTPDGNVYILARLGTETAFLMRLLGNNNIAEVGRINFPSTANKFTCRYDAKTGKYLAIVCPLVDPDCPYQRNFSALAVSD
ncbi:MAG: hypothetical protein GX938_09470, partial [Spirochaetales bacterium]|nr:hypothetical protein [Spirochaetales bacterium]